MKTHPTWLLNHAAVKKMGGTNYIEICQGSYAGKCWREDSVYVYYSLWEDFFDTLSRECIPQDFDKPEWYSEKAGNRYIHIGENIETLVWENKDEYIQQFVSKFDQRIQAAEHSYRDLAAWLKQNSSNGNAILGM